jgi:triacylglycerol lipase
MGEPWNLKDKLNFVGHSFGGATVRLITSLLTFGDADEIAATGENTSALFMGGHDCVHSCITLSAPHNGSQVANQLVDPQITFLLMSAALNVIGSVFGNNFLVFSFQLGHYGITPEEDEFRAWLNPVGIWNFYAYNDHCGYDMTLRGAAELNEKIKLAPETYYYSYTTVNTEEGKILGCQLPAEGLSPIFYISSMMLAATKGFTVDGIKIEGDWEVNDGIVPLASAIYPSCDASTALSYEDEIKKGNRIEPGRWYYFEPMVGMDHFDFCGTKDYPMGFEEFYFGMINTANSR